MKNFTRNTRKSLITASLVGLVVAVSSNANANVIDNARFYFGAGVGYNKYNLSGDFKGKIEGSNKGSVKSKTGDVLVPVLGIRFQENYGAEFGYAFHNKLQFDGVKSGNLRIRNAFVDLMGYMPMATQIDLIGGLGIGQMGIKEKSSLGAIGAGSSYNKFGLRAKIGAQYAVDNNLGVRGLVGYQRVGNSNGKHAIKSMQSANVDVIYLI
jgi:opacity protein-like surface antigen